METREAVRGDVASGVEDDAVNVWHLLAPGLVLRHNDGGDVLTYELPESTRGQCPL